MSWARGEHFQRNEAPASCFREIREESSRIRNDKKETERGAVKRRELTSSLILGRSKECQKPNTYCWREVY